MEKELIQEDTPFFTMDVKDVKYEIYTHEDEKGSISPHGVVHVSDENKEVLKVHVDIEELVINIVRQFGFKDDFDKRDVRYNVEREERNGKSKVIMTFYGPFGSLQIDEVSNLKYDTTVINP